MDNSFTIVEYDGLRKTLIDFRERSHNEANPSMEEFFESGSYPEKATVISFLRTNGRVAGTFLSREKDVFTRERIPEEHEIREDENYIWGNTLAHYVEKYNLRMPEEFEKHILQNAGYTGN